MVCIGKPVGGVRNCLLLLLVASELGLEFDFPPPMHSLHRPCRRPLACPHLDPRIPENRAFRIGLAGRVPARRRLASAVRQNLKVLSMNHLRSPARIAGKKVGISAVSLSGACRVCSYSLYGNTNGSVNTGGAEGQLRTWGIPQRTIASRSGRPPGDFTAAAKEGYETGREFRLNVAMQVDKARTDAQLFYDRHGCNSPVAKRFFKNIETYGAALGSASFKNAVERKYRR